MNVGDYVEIKEHRGGGRWSFADAHGNTRRGHITAIDKHCVSVVTDDGQQIRDVKEHFKVAEQGGSRP